jgi:hypothetical protein
VRECSAAQAALLANPPPGLRAADLFTFTLQDGVTTYRWTSFDRDLTVNGDLYSSRKPWLQRSRWNVANTMQVPSLEIYLRALNDSFDGGLDIKGQITNGLFDGAAVSLDRVWFLAGTTEINDEVGGGNPVGFSTVGIYDINAISDAATSASGAISGSKGSLLTGFGPTDIVRISEPSGQTYEAWSAWGHPAYTGFHTGSTNRVNVIPDGIASNMFAVATNPSWFDGNNGWDGYAEARSNFGTHTFSGSSTYRFYIQDNPIADNSGGISLLVESSPASSSHAGIRLFGGNVGPCEVVGNQATINIKGKSNLLDQYAPRNLYQLGCQHAFCDAGCTLSRGSFTTSYVVGSSPSRVFIPWSGSPPANASNYRYGTVTFTSGPCAGQSRTVRAGDASGLTLIHPLSATPVAGDGFDAFEGCDKALSSGSGQDCTARSNTQNWRAFPYVPPADTAF